MRKRDWLAMFGTCVAVGVSCWLILPMPYSTIVAAISGFPIGLHFATRRGGR